MSFLSAEKVLAMQTATRIFVEIVAWNAMWERCLLAVRGKEFCRSILSVGMAAEDHGTWKSFPLAE